PPVSRLHDPPPRGRAHDGVGPLRRGRRRGAGGVPARVPRGRGSARGDRTHAQDESCAPSERLTMGPRWKRSAITMSLALAAAAFAGASGVSAQQRDPNDPRIGLRAGWKDAGVAASNMELLASTPRPEGFFDPNALGNILLANSDLAFQGSNLFLGNFNGFQIHDISDPENPKLRTAVVCPGGQGDVSVWGNLLFMSVEMPNGRIDCAEGTFTDSVSTE